ncbi:MAG TPA: hypothetical protein VH186_31165 [Chloroflexia bacterium]|nr:hypothetical protein [Chloroflexia bacterium]
MKSSSGTQRWLRFLYIPAVALLLTAGLTFSLYHPTSLVLAASATAQPAPQVAGQPVTFSATGFTPGEPVSAWTTSPDGTAAALPQLTADNSGSVSFGLSTLGFVSGQWYVTLHGIRSALEAIAPFQLVDSLPDSPAPTPTPPVDSQAVPQGGLQVSPSSGFVKQIFQLSGSGYAPGEKISLWQTSPLGEANSLGTIYSDPHGNFSYTYQSYISISGLWSITAHGLISGTEKSGYFLINSAEQGEVSASASISPNHGYSSSGITVNGVNFLPSETYSYWFTGPDQRVYAGGRATTNADGTLSFKCNLPDSTTGQWVITIHGLQSNRQTQVTFQAS